MATDIGEYIVGAYLREKRGCDVINYNTRLSRHGGIEGLGELDVIGLNFTENKIILCEVTTHIQGLLYNDSGTTVSRIISKYKRQQEYVRKLNIGKIAFDPEYMLWSPVVLPKLEKELKNLSNTELKGLELRLNDDYIDAVEELVKVAIDSTHDTGNPFFRTLQILGHLRGEKKILAAQVKKN